MARLDTRVPIKSTWRTAIGKKLTNAIITKRMKEGYYGHAAQQAALNKCAPSHFINRCQHPACDETRGVKWFEFKYLEKPMFLCPQHLLVQREQAKKRAEVNKTFTRNMMEFV